MKLTHLKVQLSFLHFQQKHQNGIAFLILRVKKIKLYDIVLYYIFETRIYSQKISITITPIIFYQPYVSHF